MVHSGNSGGLLVDERGRMVGLVTSNVKHTWQPPFALEGDLPQSSVATIVPPLNFR